MSRKEMADDVVEEESLKIYLIPYLACGHMIPLCDIARLFSSRGHQVTIITTIGNAETLQHSISNHFHIHTIPFPSQEVGLPDGIELMSVTEDSHSLKVYEAAMLLKGPIEHFIVQNPPDFIVADFLYTWVHDLANKLHVPRLAFNGFSLFADTPPKELYTFLEQLRKTELKSYGLIVNNFVEVDGEEYINHYEKTTGHKAWHLGPASLIRESDEERGQKSVVSVHECLTWLNSKPLNSVLYICFGSLCHFPDKQLYEIACGIEASGHGFIWVVPEKKGKEHESDEEKEKWLPKEFEERNKMKGMIIKGWAPQVLILNHTAIGAFLTHCGWNSTMEAISAGVPMITWPVHSEQFYNEKLITQVRGIGIEVGAQVWNNCGSWKTDKLVGRDQIEKVVKRLMEDGDEADKIRKRAHEFGNKARQAIQQGGSSYNNLTALIHNLRCLKHHKSDGV
ncbi:putative UDP-glucuronosyl/UDP-glucosyltransferase, UDP-glycosyltransferase family [Lupinus albus]|uniref:Glycosyltransferase n=1 Tax=Lupinus albus TaxID=3870 RepID=A0A6A4Q6V4_LUPAL|nr:putative UDP-glucuronosyl/UDP-glucosyltransferase, UDP-glycosyltransferase family [Lupinus albus]